MHKSHLALAYGAKYGNQSWPKICQADDLGPRIPRWTEVNQMTSDLTKLPLADLSLNEADRPTAPSMPDVTEEQRGAGRHLAVIHRHHLMEIARAKAVYRHVREGRTNPEAFQKALENMGLVQNYKLFGNLCGRECQMLNFHHDAEELHVFPQLEAKGSNGLRKVVAKLRAEHLVVHELLNRLQAAASALIDTPTKKQFNETSAILDRMDQVVRSHFGYEETELAEVLGVFVDGI